ncbi:hypothetical protein Tco_1150597 [Tanacetum coccineum]
MSVINYTPASPDYPPASEIKFDPFEDPSSDHVPPLPAILPFLSLADTTTDSDTPDTPPSPTHDDSARDSSSDSSSKASSDFHSDASSDSSSRHSLSDHSSPDLPNVEVDPRETSLIDDVIVRGSDEPHLEQDIDPEIQVEIDECIAYADALRDRWIDARVVFEAVDQEESEMGTRGLVERFHDHTEAILVHRIQVIEGVQREQGHRIVRVESAVTALTQRIAELERDNRRLRGTTSVESKRVDQLQRGMSRMQRKLRQIRWLRFYNRVRVGRFEVCTRKHMGYYP